MTDWYDKIADDPKGSLGELAEGRGLSIEEFHARHERIAAFFDTDTQEEHLTLNELTLYRMHSDQLSKERINHVDQCRFCQTFVDGSEPAEVDRQIFEIEERFADWSKSSASPAPVLGLEPMKHSRGVGSTALLRMRESRWLMPSMALVVGMLVMRIPFGKSESEIYAERAEALVAIVREQTPSVIPDELTTAVLNTYTSRFYPNDNPSQMEVLLSDDKSNTMALKSAVAAADILSQYNNRTCQLGASKWIITDIKEETEGDITLLLKEQNSEDNESVGLRVSSAMSESWQAACAQPSVDNAGLLPVANLAGNTLETGKAIILLKSLNH